MIQLHLSTERNDANARALRLTIMRSVSGYRIGRNDKKKIYLWSECVERLCGAVYALMQWNRDRMGRGHFSGLHTASDE